MQGKDEHGGSLTGHCDLEAWVPKDYPLRTIRELTNATLAEMSNELDLLHTHTDRPEIAPDKLLRALLIQALYSIRSDRRLMEQLEFNLLYRWFVGLGIEDPVWDAADFARNRDQLLAEELAARFPERLIALPATTRLLSQEHFSVDWTCIEAWASIDSFGSLNEHAPAEDGGEELADGSGRIWSRAFLAVLIGLVSVLGVVLILPIGWLVGKIKTRHSDTAEEGEVIENWQAVALPNHLLITGTVSCHEGRIWIRLYEDEAEQRRYLGTAIGTILMHQFYAVATGVRKPRNLSISYTIVESD